MDLKRIEKLAFREMGTRKDHDAREPGWLYYHGLRTAKIARKLAKRLDIQVEHDIMYAGALLHDIGKGTSEHAETGAAILKKKLKLLCNKFERKLIREIVRNHNRRGTEDDFPIEILLVQDADLIDHVGPMTPWLTFYWAGTKSETIEDHMSWVLGNENARYRKSMRRSLNLEPSIKMFDERRKWEDAFLKDFREVYLGKKI